MENWGQVAVFDLETTGVDVDTARIVSACVGLLAADGALIERWDWLANPGVEIPAGAAAVHGITTERARAEGRPAVVVISEIAQALRVLFALGVPLVVYNAPYDLSLLDRECRRHGLDPLSGTAPVIDPLVIDKQVDRYRKGKRTLEATAQFYDVTLDEAHDAGSDAIAAGRVAQALGRKYPDDLDIPLAELHDHQQLWYTEQAASFQDYIRSVKGDELFVAATDWPLRPTAEYSSFLDTQPIAAPPPRPSLTVPVVDWYGTGVIALELPMLVPPTPTPTLLPPGSDPMTPDAVTGDEAPAEPTRPVDSEDRVDFELPAWPEANPGEPEPSVAVARTARPAVLRIAAGIVTAPDGRTLIMRQVDETAFTQPGGDIAAGESALEALARSLREEVGLHLDPDRTEYLGSFRATDDTDTVVRAEVFALRISLEQVAALVGSAQVAEMRWLEQAELDQVELAPLTRETILPLWVERRSALF